VRVAKGARSHRSAASGKNRHAKHTSAQRKAKHSKPSPAPKETVAPLTGELALVKEAIDLARKAKTQEATDIGNKIADPAAQKLVEWYILRHPATTATFGRYAAFIAANPEWPSAPLLRRRAEARLWEQRSDATTVRGFIGDRPTSAKGRLALARVLLAEGDRDGAARLARDAWRSDELSEPLETAALETFRDFLNRDHHRARMNKRIGAKDLAGARRAAKRLGDDELAIVKACAAVREKANKALDALDDVAAEARQDLGYTLCRIQWMLAKDRIDDAARLMMAASPETMSLQETDQWWRERRMLARKLLDQGMFQTAYDVVRPAATPANEYYRPTP
jgi:soluble lytic murein transglycosylase